MNQEFPAAFARVVNDSVERIIQHQQPDGSIIFDPAAPFVFPQQAIFPLSFCYAGIGPDQRHRGDARVRQAILKLGDFLVSRFTDKGEMQWDSFGNKVAGVDQRLTYAWIEGLRICREAGGDFPFERWTDKILRACQTLREHRMEKLVGIRRFTGRVMGTSTNHVALYVPTLYRAGQVLDRPELCEFILPIARALAADVHPDGYWEEHGDLARGVGPTGSYNYLTHCGMSLMYEWTGDQAFAEAIAKSTNFHARFSYPDATFLDLIDERVRYGVAPRVWGLFGFSHSPVGRGVAMDHFHRFMGRTEKNLDQRTPELMARCCENFMYWHSGPSLPPPYREPNHQAQLTLPAGIFRRGKWSIALSAMRATNIEDPHYRDNAFALDRQKLISVWHEDAGLIFDGSHSKNQPENSTFCVTNLKTVDYWPVGGSVGQEEMDVVLSATYKTFYGHIRVRALSDKALQIDLTVDPAACRGPFIVGFTLPRRGTSLVTSAGRTLELGETEARLEAAEVGGSLRHGNVTIGGPADLRVQWPLSPFNSYAATGKAPPEKSQVRVFAELTMERPTARFTLSVG